MRSRARTRMLAGVLVSGMSACGRAPAAAGPHAYAARAQQPTTPAAPRCATVPAASASGDADADGLSDDCEQALAAAFAPELVADAADCLWDADARGGARLRGGYLYAVAPMQGGRVRIAYLPAYFRDCGWSGGARLLRLGRRRAHGGDSEMIAVDAEQVAGSGWEAVGVFTSAHCGGRAGAGCRWWRGQELGALDWAGRPGRGAPRVWVARDKHAHYPTRTTCERGHHRQERCAAGATARRFRFPVVSAEQNIGSRERPAMPGAGCVPAAALPLGARGAAPDAVECLWSDSAPFRGWQAGSTGRAPTSYGAVLRRYAGL